MTALLPLFIYGALQAQKRAGPTGKTCWWHLHKSGSLAVIDVRYV
jgi:hypothetical protein